MKILCVLMMAVMAAVAAGQSGQSQAEPPRISPGDPAIDASVVKPNLVRLTQTVEQNGKVVNRLNLTLRTVTKEYEGKKLIGVAMKSDDPAKPITGELVLDGKTLAPLNVE